MVGGLGDAWCIFPYKDAAANLHDQVTGLVGGRLPFDGMQEQRFGGWAGSTFPMVHSLPKLGASFDFLPYLPQVSNPLGPDFNHDGTPDIWAFDKHDAGTGKTVYFVLNGKAPDQFLQIGATAMSSTDANWDFGVVG